MKTEGIPKILCCGKDCEVRGTCARCVEIVGGDHARVLVMISCIGQGLYEEINNKELKKHGETNRRRI